MAQNLVPQNPKELRKRLVSHLLDIIGLRMVASEESSGYDIIGAVLDEFGMLKSSGTVYSMLYSLERQGLITGRWVERKRVYTLTDEGRKRLRLIRTSTDPDVAPFKPLIFQANSKGA